MIRFCLWLANGFISTFGYAYLYYKISDAQKKIDLKIFFIYLFGVISVTLIEYFDIEILHYFFFFFFFPLLLYNINKVSARKLIFYLVIIWLYGAVIDILLILMLSFFFYLFKYNLFSHSELISMILTFLVSIVQIILGKFGVFNIVTKWIDKKISQVKYSDGLLVVFSLFVLIVGVAMLLNIKNLSINMLLMLIIFLMVITFVVLVKYKINYEENIRYLNTLKENNEFYIKMDDENRIFKHNLIAKLLSIKSVSNKKAMSLIEDLIIQFNKSVNFSQSIKVIPYGLNGIIYQKLYPYLQELDVKICNEIDYDIFTVLKPRRYNVFVEKMIITLDNAIESCLSSKNKSMAINIFDEGNNICIEIENTFSNDIHLDSIGNKNYTTKGLKHGLGLFSAFRNNEASLDVKIINNVFVSKISAKKRLID